MPSLSPLRPSEISQMGRMRRALQPKPLLTSTPAPTFGFKRASLSVEALQHFERTVERGGWKRRMAAYIEQTSNYLAAVIPSDKRVLMVGALTSEVLEKLNPSYGVALDVSEQAVRLARSVAPSDRLKYYCGLPENFQSQEVFDYIVVLNVVDYSDDLFTLIGSLERHIHEDTRIVLSTLNPLWHPLIKLASKLKIRIPDHKRNLVSFDVLQTALQIKGFQVTDVTRRVLFPKRVPFISHFINRFLARVPGLNRFCFLQYVSAVPVRVAPKTQGSCSVIIPCYNEEGNIAECVKRVPKMGAHTEIVVVNDGSKDGTVRVVEGLLGQFPNLKFVNYEKNRGKGNAVVEGIRASTGDVLIILDADMTVPPEELSDFFEALDSKTADFASGTRFLYPMEKEAMRFANFLGNIFFSKIVEMILGSKCSDTLCGTKAMRKRDYQDFKLEDTAWGDFDLIFHAASKRLKSIQIPVHYKSRVNGESKMKAFSAGVKFLKLCARKWVELP